MKRKSIRVLQIIRLFVLGLLIAMLVLSSPLYAAQSVSHLYSDEELYRWAQEYERERDWTKGAMFLFAYIQRNPDRMRQNLRHSSQVAGALNFFVEQNYSVARRLGNCEESLEACDSAYEKLKNTYEGASSRGVFLNPTPRPAQAPPLDNLPPSPPRSHPLVCRGGGEMKFTYEVSSDISTKPHLQITFDKAALRVGDRGENLLSLDTGQCTRIDRTIAWNEPNTIVLRHPWLQTDKFSIAWTEQGDVQLLKVPEVLRTLRTPFFESFHVYNDGSGHSIVTKRGLVIGPLEVDSQRGYRMGYEDVNGLRVGARLYTDRNYTYESMPGFLAGSTYIMTACNDKSAGDNGQFLSVQTNRPTTVYVGHDSRYESKPTWLANQFRNTGCELVFEDGWGGDVSLVLYDKKFSAGSIVLGSNTVPGERGNFGMYTVVMKVDHGQARRSCPDAHRAPPAP